MFSLNPTLFVLSETSQKVSIFVKISSFKLINLDQRLKVNYRVKVYENGKVVGKDYVDSISKGFQLRI